MKEPHLKTLRTSNGCKYDEEFGIPVLTVSDPHMLVQTVGYMKHAYSAAGRNVGVFLRGQRELYSGKLVPSAYRKSSNVGRTASRVKKMIAEFRSHEILESLRPEVVEPLLQHYGIRSRWIDLVDNVWIALWFACHIPKCHAKSPRHMHYERPPIDPWDGGSAYILMVEADLECDDGGLYRSKRMLTVDLRRAAPSVFVRPHSQHGISIRKMGETATNCADLIRGAIKIDLELALSWIGSGTILTTHAIFPPPYYDHGYRILIDGDQSFDPILGEIQSIGP